MNIDLTATKDALLATGRTISGWSRVHDLNPDTVKQFFYGKFVATSLGGVYGRIVAALQSDGLLVKVDEEGQSKAA